MRVIVCGSRRWHDRKVIEYALYELGCKFGGNGLTIVHGGARGADRIAHQEAQKAGLLVEEWPAMWDDHGKRAGLIRNEQMAAMGADLCVAFWDGRSTGTAHMIETAKRHGIPVQIVGPASYQASPPGSGE